MTKHLVNRTLWCVASVNIYEAKTQLSKLIKRVRAGEEVIIADAGRPVAKLVPIDGSRQARVLGADAGTIWMADDAFAPMSRAELAAWEKGGIFPAEPTARKRRRSSRKKAAPTRRSRNSPG